MATARKFDTSPPPPPQPTLKLYDPELRGSRPPAARSEPPPAPQSPAEPAHPGGLTPDTRFSAFYRTYAEPEVLCGVRRVSEGTLMQYRLTVARFTEICGDLPLRAITEEVNKRFRDGLLLRKGLLDQRASSETVRKVLTHYECLLGFADARHQHHNPDGIDKHGLFGFDEDGDRRCRPRVYKPGKIDHDPRPITLEELAAVIDASHGFALPERLPTDLRRQAWRAIWVWNYNVGTRIRTTLAARWSWFRTGTNWLTIPAKYFKGGRRDVTVYVNRHAMAEARLCRQDGNDLIFPVGINARYFMKLARDLMTLAGLPPTKDGGPCGSHSCRKALATYLMERNNAAAKLQLGHKTGDVTLTHYVKKQGMIGRLLERVPQPVCRIPIADPRLQKDQPGQRLLF